MGDTHGLWGDLNVFLNKKKPDILVVCGDFGHWPGHDFASYKRIKNPNTKIYWCDGNHENHHDLRDRLNKGDPRRIMAVGDNIYYVPRGRCLDLPFLGNTMFLGGAHSIDKQWRTPGLDWFPEEILREADVSWVSPNVKVDTIISHTCPEEFDIQIHGFEKLGKVSDPTRHVLSMMLEKYKPKKWYFGHWHTFQSGKYAPTEGGWSCEWQSLGMLGDRWQNHLMFYEPES